MAEPQTIPFTVKAPDGTLIRGTAPAGSTPEEVLAYVKRHGEKLAPQLSPLERFGYGFTDPIYGGAQIGARMDEEAPGVVPDPAEKQRRIESVDLQVREREQKYKTGTTAVEGLDLARLAGTAANPMEWLPAAAGGWPGAIATGAMSALVEPVTEEGGFGGKKAAQVAEGVATGTIFGLGGRTIPAVGKFLAREYPEALQNQAVERILRRMRQDEKAGGPSAVDVLDLINTSAAKGKPLTIADVTGENTLGLAGNVARQPGESRAVAKSFLTQRDEAAAQRIGQDIAKYVHGGESMHKTTEALLQARSAASSPRYEEMEKLEGIWNFRLSEFLDDPVLKSGMKRGYEVERLNALAEGRPFNPHQMGIDLDVDGNVKLIKAPNMRVLDMGKQGLDAMIADERNEITGRLSARGVALDRVRRAYVGELDALDTSGVYKAARATWAGYSKSLDAVRAGRAIFRASPEEIAAEFNSLSPGDREFYRLGVADMLRERLGKTGLSGDDAKAIIKNPWMRDQLKPVFRSNEDFNSFVDAVGSESRMFETKRRVLGGSETAGRVAEDETSLIEQHGHSVLRLLAGGHPLTALEVATRIWKDIGLRSNPKVNEAVAKILFSPGIDVEGDVGRKLVGQMPLKKPTALPMTEEVARFAVPAAVAPTVAAETQPRSAQ